jgi:mono/diheme cytochrome c family protein
VKALIKNTLVALTIVSAFAACNYKVDKRAASPGGVDSTVEGAKNVDFETIRSNVFQPRCYQCHSAAGGNKSGVNVETYAAVKQELAEIKASIEDNSMPKNQAPLSDEQKHLFMSWITAGAPEKIEPGTPETPPTDPASPNHPVPAPGPEEVKIKPEDLNYANVNVQVIQPACLKCHASPADADADFVNLETFKTLKLQIDYVKAEVEQDVMPKRSKLTAFQKKLLLTWIAVGAPEQASDAKPIEPPVPSAKPTEPKSEQPPATGVKNSVESQSLARGKYLFGLASCNVCHTADAAKPLAGGKAVTSSFGTFYAPNISVSKTTGIGQWTDADFIRAFRDGKSPKGDSYFPAFPFTSYSKMSDEDLLAIKSYISSLPAVEQENKKHDVKFPFNQRKLIVFWRSLYFSSPKTVTLKNYMTAKGPYQYLTDKDKSWNRGAYLVEGPMHCTQCHTSRDKLGGLLRAQWMAGAPFPGKNLIAPNLTPDAETGVGKWTRQDWTVFLKEGKTPSGSKVGGEMREIVLHGTALLTAADREAVIDYFQSLAPVSNPDLAAKLAGKQ